MGRVADRCGRIAAIALAVLLAHAAPLCAEAVAADDSAVWRKVHASVFAGAPIAPADDVLALETPQRAEDAAIVPVAIRARFPQSRERSIDRVWLIVDNNPSPVAAVFHFTPESGRADIETRIRIEEYTWVRAVAMTGDGRLYMAARFVKASGGCSAPASKDALAAQANLGRMRLRTEDVRAPGEPVVAQLMISHPNTSGLAMDQLTRTYAAPHFVREVDVRYAGRSVLRADVDFSISENPNFRFYFSPAQSGELEARVVDNQDLQFNAALRVEVPGGGAASALPR